MNSKFRKKTLLKNVIAVALIANTSGLWAGGIDKDNKKRSAPVASKEELKLSFRNIPYLEKAFISKSPKKLNDGIAVGKLGKDGGDKEKLIKLTKEIAKDKQGNFDSLLVSHKGKLIFESYFKRGRIDLPHPQASSTKSYTSLAVGRAIQLGYLTMEDLNKPLISFLKDLDKSKLVEGAEKITLHTALTMSSGIQINRDTQRELAKNPEQLKGQGQVQKYLEINPPITTETQKYKYNNNDPKFVMQALDTVVPGGVKTFIKKELLDKMGISNYGWQDDVSGLPYGPYASSMTSRNMLKWGTLIANKGQWNGEQLISEAFFNKATNKIVHMGEDDIFFTSETVTNPGYGYFFWLADMKYDGKTYFSRSAQGGGGQYIILIEELDLIIVMTAHHKDDKTMQVAAERILPAFVK